MGDLGIERIEALHYYVRDLERTRRFLRRSLQLTHSLEDLTIEEAEGEQE